MPKIFGRNPSGGITSCFCKLSVVFVLLSVVSVLDGAAYYGKPLGPLSQFHHGVKGDVFAVDSRTIFIRGFSYDGEGPAAYFYAGDSKSPSGSGFRIRDEHGSEGVLRRYRNEDITLTLPDDKTLHSIKWISVWCDDFSVNFGDVRIPRNLDFPKPQKIAGLDGVHAVSSDNIVIVDAQTLLIPNFSYDGEAPDAKFWVGRGAKPSPNGFRIPDENGKETPLRRYDHKTIVLTLPEDKTVFDIGHFGVWCEAFTVDFGHIQIPPRMNIPPSLRMLGVSPQSKLNCEVLYEESNFEVRWAVAGESIVVQLVAKLEDNEYMSFGLSGENEKTVMVGGDVAVAWVDKETGKGYVVDYILEAKSQCAGKHGSCPDENFRESTNSLRLLNAAMVNGYSIVTYQRPLRAVDEFDREIFTNGSQAIIWAIGPLNQRKEVSFHSQWTKSDTSFDFARQPVWHCPMPEADDKMLPNLDKPAPTRGRQPVVERQTESNRRPVENQRRPNENRRRGQNRFQSQSANDEFTTTTIRSRQSVESQRRQSNAERGSNRRRTPVPTPAPAPKAGAWEIPPIQCYEPEDGVFYAQMGPTGGKQGYPAITGHVGWGISWYINGLLIPEVNVVRGKTYTFVVEGGFDPDTPARYHPFYITDDPVGGYEHKTPEEKSNINIYAGVRQSPSGDIIPTGVGRLCNWTPNSDGPGADEYPSFGAYQRSLSLKCDQGEPGVITWTPDAKTPDTVYYQCFTHRYLGWKINVVDRCDEQKPFGSENVEVFAKPDEEDELESLPSIRVATRVKPNNNYLKDHEKEFEKSENHKIILNSDVRQVVEEIQEDTVPYTEKSIINSHSNGVQLDTKNADLTKTIQDGILAAELLEDSIKKFTADNLKTGPVLFGTTPKYQEDDDFTKDLAVPPKPNIPTYLRPPTSNIKQIFNQNYNVMPRRPYNQNRNVPRHPVLLPKPQLQRPINRPFLGQQSMVINHYKKPIFKHPVRAPIDNGFRHNMNFNRPPFNPVKNIFMPQSMGRPLPDAAILGEPSDIKEFLSKPGQIIIGKPMQAPIKPGLLEQHIKNGFPVHSTIQFTTSTQTPAATQRLDSFNYSKDLIVSTVTANEDKMRPAVNTGFKPDSVIIEGGFRPILREEDIKGLVKEKSDTKEFADRRMDTLEEDNGQDAEYEDETGEDNFNSRGKTELFEPIFIPSPLDRNSENKTDKHGSRNRKKTTAGKDDGMKIEDGEDKMALAADRVEAYYLPPSNPSGRRKPSSNGNLKPGTIVTYDGKTVSDSSIGSIAGLIDTKLSNDNIYPSRSKISNRYIPPGSSKTEQLVRGPQTGPFRGEIPPPIPDIIKTDSMPQLHLKGSRNTHELPLNPNPSSIYKDNKRPAAISTHLTLVRNIEEDDFNKPEYLAEESKKFEQVLKSNGHARSKRSPHHTAEHTEMQKKEGKLEDLNRNGATYSRSIFILIGSSFILSNYIF